jgi:hypothetical protein
MGDNTRHLSLLKIHPQHVAAEEVDKRKVIAHTAKVDHMLSVQANSSASVGTQAPRPSSVPSFKRFTLTKIMVTHLTSQMVHLQRHEGVEAVI